GLHRTTDRRNRQSYPLVAALAAATACTLAGCATMPTSPLSSAIVASDAAPSSARRSAGNTTAASTPSRMPDDPGQPGGADTTAAAGVQASESVASDVLRSFTGGRTTVRSVSSEGADVSASGGALTNGRWTLTVPANAVPAGAHFTLSVPGARGAACQVQVTPANAAIKAPLTLTV